MVNNMSRDSSDIQVSNVICEFRCPIGDCARRPNSSYIGHTTTSLSRRITLHLQNGAPEKHVRQHHGRKLTRSMMVENTSIIARCPKKHKLATLEAVHIRDRDPAINRQMNMTGTLSFMMGDVWHPGFDLLRASAKRERVLCGLLEKSKYERPGTARPDTTPRRC